MLFGFVLIGYLADGVLEILAPTLADDAVLLPAQGADDLGQIPYIEVGHGAVAVYAAVAEEVAEDHMGFALANSVKFLSVKC